MKIVELILDEEQILSGVQAISIVEQPAIESDFIALSKEQEYKLAEVDGEKRILMGPALIPNKTIFRKNGEEEYYIYFSKNTVRKVSEMFLAKGNQNKSTLEHNFDLEGLSVVESWIVEGEKDKTREYGMNVPVGTWMVSMKVYNDQVWNEYVKTGKVKGFSIEGYFADKVNMSQINEEDESQEILDAIIEELRHVNLVSYSDYPSGVKNNAKRGIELNKKVNNKCATQVGKVRAQQLAQGQGVSLATVKRMYSYLSRAETYYDESDTKACGTISYLLWGGKAGKRWAESKLKELGELKLKSMVIDEDFAIIDDRLAYSTQEKAEEMAKNIGCKGFHTHDFEGKTWYMPCETHIKDDMYETKKCPKGFKKNKQGRCVKMSGDVDLAVGPRGGIVPVKKAPRSSTPNPNPKGKGTARGDAKTTRSAKVSKKDEASLKKKSDDFNERYKKKLGYGVNVGMLKTVFQRGLGAFNVSHSPVVKSASQWAFARVNAYLYLVKNGRPQNPKYKGDYDLLPTGHPKKSKAK